MMTERESIDELELLQYADGHFDDDPLAKAGLESKFQQHPELAAKAHDYRAQTEALRLAFVRLAQEPIPDQHLAVLNRPCGSSNRSLALSATFVLMAMTGLLAGWVLGYGHRAEERPGQNFARLSLEDYLTTTSVAKIKSPNGKPLNWLSQEMSLRFRVPDLTDIGYSLVDQRTVNEADDRMVRLTYAASDGRQFSLFLKPRWDERKRALELSTKRNVSLAFWLEGPLASAIASRLPPQQTLAIAKRIQNSLLDLTIAHPTLQPIAPAASAPGPSAANGAVTTSTIPQSINSPWSPEKSPLILPN
jgi:anti-sigma factor RsiW